MNKEFENLLDFIEDNGMYISDADDTTNIVFICDRAFLLVCPTSDKVFSTEMKLMVSSYEKSEAEGADADYVFEFGGNYYWTKRDAKAVEFNDLRYIGKMQQTFDNPFSHLGVHGGYEIMSGSGRYKYWCEKAKFLGHVALGICEYNTLAGAVAFQTECKDAKIKPVIGMTINVTYPVGSEILKTKCKVYAKNEFGWRNLLRIHKAINIDGDGDTVDINTIIPLLDGLVFVLGWGFRVSNPLVRVLSKKNLLSDVYYQIDSIVLVDSINERFVLENVKTYIEEYAGDIQPVLINDTYYLDKDYYHIKNKLNASSGKFHNKSNNTYYKSVDESYEYLKELFDEDDDRILSIIEIAGDNTIIISDSISFAIETGVVKMPKFEVERVVGRYAGRESGKELFWDLIGDGMETLMGRIGSDKFDIYQDRIEMEAGVIENGGFIDYFLVVWDILNWSQDNGIYTGIGRGSAGGCLIAYLLNITRIDPIEYNLPFERFMNAGRLAGSLPDIDSDFEGLRRDDVKRYIESKYGNDYVCSIGSYSKLRVKAAMNEMWLDRSKLGTLKYATAMIDNRDGDWDEIFKSANKKPKLKDFVLENVDFINNVKLVLDQPKNTSIHAAGVVIVPKTDSSGNPMTIYDWMPVTRRDGVLVSEWEGTYLEKCGFMKNDILGTRQLDKFRYITDLIKKDVGDDVDIYSIPVNDTAVYGMFEQGWTEDTFHFGSTGLKSYCKQVAPVVIDDLIDTISLHRPALMDIGAHKDFVNIRRGVTKVSYDFMLENITKSTNGILVYQEQVMEAVKAIGGFTMQEADDVRRAMGKKKIEVITPYKNQFVKGAIERGCPENEANDLWHKLELFSGYGFNRSHATAYAMTGYVGMWLKVHYPLQFWAAAFKYSLDEDVPKFVSEMIRTGKTGIAPPNINTSTGEFTVDSDKNVINWSLSKIKQVGNIATEDVIAERDSPRGKFFSMSEMFERVTRKKVNRKVITSMIYAGCMDSFNDVKNIKDRVEIFKEYAKCIGDKLESMVDKSMIKNEFWWSVKQKMVSGLGVFDYNKLIQECKYSSKFPFMNASDVQDSDSVGSRCVVAGTVIDMNMHTAGKGEFANILLDSNNDQVWVTCWNETWVKIKDSIIGDKDNPTVKLLIISGRVTPDSYKGCNVIEVVKGVTTYELIDSKVGGKYFGKS